MPASPAWCSCSGARSGSSCLASTTRIQRLRSRFLCSSLGQHHLSVREWDESKQMRELVSRCPRGARSGADVGREVLAGEGGAGGDEVSGCALEADGATGRSGAGTEVDDVVGDSADT